MLKSSTVIMGLAVLCTVASSQELSTTSTQSVSSLSRPVIPQQVRFGGTLPNRAGDTVEAVFRIYSKAEGGEPLWTVTQKIVVAQDGTYSVLLGAASAKGLPQTVFGSGQARWCHGKSNRGDHYHRSGKRVSAGHIFEWHRAIGSRIDP